MIEGSRSPPPTLPLGSCRSREMSAMVSALTIVCGLKPDLQTPQNAIDEELAEENHDCSGTEERHTPTETLDLLQTNSEASNPENPHLDAKAYSNDYVEYPPPLSEIHEVVRVACQSHRLPLAQIWLPGTYFTMHYSVPMGNPLAMDFRDVCFRRPLLKGQGIVGEAFATRKPCFSTDVASYCTAKYPLSHFAKMCGLQGAIAIPAYWTRSISPSDHRFIPDYVLELFLPLDCTDVSEQKNIVMSLLSLLTLRLSVVDAEVQHSTGTDDSLFRNDNATKTLDGKLQEQWSRDDQNFIEIMRQALLHDADNYCQDSFTSVAESGTSEGVEKTTDLPAGSLKDAEKSSTQGTSTGSSRGKRDPAWKYCFPIKGNSHGVKCHFCNLVIQGGGITRFKLHLVSSDPSKNVKKCPNVPYEVKIEVEEWLKRKENKRKQPTWIE